MSASELSLFDHEYKAVKTGRALVDLDSWSSISVTGADRQPFLHNFCTNEVKRLVTGAACEAFFTNVKGKIVGHGVISCRDDETVVVGTPGLGSRLVEHLDRYVIREDVSLRDTTAERSYLLVVGSAEDQTPFPAISWDIVGRSDSKLFEIRPSEKSEIVNGFITDGFVIAGLPVFEAARIEAGTPLFGVDFNEENFPQEVGRDREAISFTKGCYLGQETVARIDALGHVNQQLVRARFFGSEVPANGAVLTREGRSVGRITSAAFSPTLEAAIALAMVRREANSPGTRLKSPIGECEVAILSPA